MYEINLEDFYFIFYVVRVWDEKSYLWLDFVDVIVILLLVVDIVECICCLMNYCFFLIGIFFVEIIYDYSLIFYLWFKVYFILCMMSLSKLCLKEIKE